MIRVVLPAHLRTLARIDGDIRLDLAGDASLSTVFDALETRFPMLRGTIRDQTSHKRRPFVRFLRMCE